ncbi:uncharacterized protein LOC110983290 [Acanthaster planci]|uniref:Uncharacterized protein LOC110983290 n=1 Tax=Acanthaster planci TaxID=133434 RepID=A0A8B7YZJ0_ACAPL|nr:uncharacterized protein LOC110983290 [Acanthaster planci]
MQGSSAPFTVFKMTDRSPFRCSWQAKHDFILFLVFHSCCFQTVHGGLQAFSIIGKSASQSTSHPSFPAGNAIDNNVNSFSHTVDGGDLHPWWRVDLGAEHCLGELTVITRQGCCGQRRFAAAVARAGPSPNYAENQPCGLPVPRAQATDGARITFPCAPARMARYVTLDINSTSSDVTKALLQLAEVTVKVYTAGECDAVDVATSTPKARTPNFNKIHKDGLIANSRPLSVKVAKSVLRCAGYCAKDIRCFSFDFAQGDGQCRLYNLNTTDIEMTPSRYFSVYVLM